LGEIKLADKIELQQADLNKEIINAFQNNFNFCPTYFFYSDYSREVSENQFDRVEFLNNQLQPDTTITIFNRTFLTAEFGTIEQSPPKKFNGYDYTPGENGPERTTSYIDGPNMGFGALVIKSGQFKQLSSPFPYYVRTFDSLPFKRSPITVVKKMNRKLHRFYKRRNKGANTGVPQVV
jgi:hypothetical protein